ncbi:hypothetical protein FACS1894187_19270 [Synergistales bacterium]|nr:hypothetical protein FACS1894187_19270 [Synergistales bacterium]
MTNFEKWKRDLTVQTLCRVLNCIGCPVSYCRYVHANDIDIDGHGCLATITEWASKEAGQ